MPGNSDIWALTLHSFALRCGRKWSKVVKSDSFSADIYLNSEKGAKNMRDQILRGGAIVTIYGVGMFFGMLFLFR